MSLLWVVAPCLLRLIADGSTPYLACDSDLLGWDCYLSVPAYLKYVIVEITCFHDALLPRNISRSQPRLAIGFYMLFSLL